MAAGRGALVAAELAVDDRGEALGVVGGGERGEKLAVEDDLAVVSGKGEAGGELAVDLGAGRGEGVGKGSRAAYRRRSGAPLFATIPALCRWGGD